jgi:vacuolar-type H+-ATPase subunit H
MANTALDRIKQIEEKAKAEIEALKSEAISDVAHRLNAAKKLVADLEREYEALTGKTVRGEKVTRSRMTRKEKLAATEQIAQFIRSSKAPVSMADISETVGLAAAQVRGILKTIKGLKTTGNRAGTRYAI